MNHFPDAAQVSDTEASAKRIADTVLSLPEDTVPIMAAHNGPTNLGSDAWSISGVDFKPGAGDVCPCMVKRFKCSDLTPA